MAYRPMTINQDIFKFQNTKKPRKTSVKLRKSNRYTGDDNSSEDEMDKASKYVARHLCKQFI